MTLALLVPGAVADDGLDTSHVGVLGNNNISFNGGRMQYNNWEIDGGNNTDEGSAGTFNTYPNLDTIAEFRISTSNYGAEMGKHSGATIEVATKSGPRSSTAMPSNMCATTYSTPIRGTSIEPRSAAWRPRALSSGMISATPWGGRSTFPAITTPAKSKTFFYWSEDWRRYREGQTVGAGVPTILKRQGNFSECDPSSVELQRGSGLRLHAPLNPATGNLYPGDTVPIDPNASAC